MDDPVFIKLSSMISTASAEEYRDFAPGVPANFDWQTWLFLMLLGGNVVGAWTAIQNVRPAMKDENFALFSEAVRTVLLRAGGLDRLKILGKWPKGAQPLPAAIKYQYLEAVKAGKPEEWKGLQMSLRSGRNKNRNERAARSMSNWMGPSFQQVQMLLREGAGDAYVPNVYRQQLQNMKAYFARIVALTPRGIPRGITHVYRGISGPAARAMESNGHYRDAGFNSFSRDVEIARRFATQYAPAEVWPSAAQGCLLVRLAVKDIEPGTPLVWFDLKETAEQEVLFPPGTLTVLPGGTDGYMVPVKYQRDHAFLGR